MMVLQCELNSILKKHYFLFRPLDHVHHAPLWFWYLLQEHVSQNLQQHFFGVGAQKGYLIIKVVIDRVNFETSDLFEICKERHRSRSDRVKVLHVSSCVYFTAIFSLIWSCLINIFLLLFVALWHVHLHVCGLLRCEICIISSCLFGLQCSFQIDGGSNCLVNKQQTHCSKKLP